LQESTLLEEQLKAIRSESDKTSSSQSVELDSARTELSEAKKQAIYLSGDLTKKEAERADAVKRLEAAQHQTEELTASLEAVKKELDERIQDLIQTKERLAQEFTEKVCFAFVIPPSDPIHPLMFDAWLEFSHFILSSILCVVVVVDDRFV